MKKIKTKITYFLAIYHFNSNFFLGDSVFGFEYFPISTFANATDHFIHSEIRAFIKFFSKGHVQNISILDVLYILIKDFDSTHFEHTDMAIFSFNTIETPIDYIRKIFKGNMIFKNTWNHWRRITVLYDSHFSLKQRKKLQQLV